MKRNKKRFFNSVMIVALLFLLAACSKKSVKPIEPVTSETVYELTDKPDSSEASESPGSSETPKLTESPGPSTDTADGVKEEGEYTSAPEVAAYIHAYGHLPDNYITKKEAEELGWNGGSLEPYAPGKSIGGDRFGNYEGLLPGKKGRKYYECDIDTPGKSTRGAKRIIYSDDGLIYYTDDHYASFSLLYDIGE